MELDKIKLNPNNPRFIKDEKFKSLVKSLVELPVMTTLREIVIDEDNVIIGGNMRFRAAKEAGWTDIPVKIFTREMADENNKLTNQNKTYEDYCKEIMVKDNISGGEWDWELLSSQFEKEKLEDWGLDVGKWENEGIVEDEVPEVTENPVSKIGEVYQLGKHKLMCGDSTKIEDVEKLMGGVKADMVFTDPPYNVDYTGKTKDALKIDNDKFDAVDFLEFLKKAFNNMSTVVKSGASIYVCHADSEGINFRLAFTEAGFLLKQCIIWNKNSMVMGRQDYQWKHEPILYGWKDGGSHHWFGSRSEVTVWDIDRPTRSSEHPTMKPLALIAKAINNSSKSDDVILDLFLGSGSTLITCQQTNRICYGMEIDEKYCDVIRKRYAKFINSEDWESATPKIL